MEEGMNFCPSFGLVIMYIIRTELQKATEKYCIGCEYCTKIDTRGKESNARAGASEQQEEEKKIRRITGDSQENNGVLV